MNKIIIMIVCLLLFKISNLYSQDISDNYIGKYQCNVTNCSLNQFGQYECKEVNTTTLNFEKAANNQQIEVTFADNEHFLLSKENDSIYIYPTMPYISALFYAKDSLKLSRVHSSIGYSVYTGKKAPNSITYKSLDLNITPSPNPFQDRIIIENFDNKNSVIQLSDLNGKIINTTLYKSENNVIIETENTNKGIYLLQIKNPHSLYTYKMVKL